MILRSITLACGLLIGAGGCTADDVTATTSNQVSESMDESVTSGVRAGTEVLIANYRVPREDVLSPGEDPGLALEQTIQQLIALDPRFADDELVTSFKSDSPLILLTLPVEWERAAPLIARAYQLLEISREGRLELRAERLRALGIEPNEP